MYEQFQTANFWTKLYPRRLRSLQLSLAHHANIMLRSSMIDGHGSHWQIREPAGWRSQQPELETRTWAGSQSRKLVNSPNFVPLVHLLSLSLSLKSALVLPLQMQAVQHHRLHTVRYKKRRPQLSKTHPSLECKGYRRFNPLGYSDPRVEPKRQQWCCIDIPNYRLRYHRKGVSNSDEEIEQYWEDLQSYNNLWNQVEEQATLLLHAKAQLGNVENAKDANWARTGSPSVGGLLTAPRTSDEAGGDTAPPSMGTSGALVMASKASSNLRDRLDASLVMQEGAIRNLRLEVFKRERLHMEAALQKSKLETQLIEAELKALPTTSDAGLALQLAAEESTEKLIKELGFIVERPSGSSMELIEGPSQGNTRRGVITYYDLQQDAIFQAFKRVDSSSPKGKAKAVENAPILSSD
ncbi:hypothetical protein FPV67DRAFT_1451744 [Lyophyllum atratum]|nr:hypothetical protein FPV67DRAFT_1456481 [Lyophyllum atratum]KAF8063257.1 hypothetical protein FPV67DRAFT_1451744 [Lyophyllum atratum]